MFLATAETINRAARFSPAASSSPGVALKHGELAVGGIIRPPFSGQEKHQRRRAEAPLDGDAALF
jgi:hypothetical protein